ncbi:MAG: hypothetical protein ABIQ74_02410 [Chitinophagales bacterium]
MKVSAALSSIAEKVIQFPGLYSSESLRVIAGHTYPGTNSKARRELGYVPGSLEEGLEQTLQFDMEELGIKPAVNSE